MPRTRRREPMSDINVVPYIDVMLVLLIIFMVTAPLLTQGVSVELPQAPADPLPLKEEEPLIISIKADGSYYLNLGEDENQATSLEEISDKIGKILRLKPKTAVLVKGDKEISYNVVVQLMATLQAAGAASIGLITESPLAETK